MSRDNNHVDSSSVMVIAAVFGLDDKKYEGKLLELLQISVETKIDL